MRTLPLILGGLLVTGIAQADADVNVDVDYESDDIVLRSEQGSLPATGIEQLYLESEVGEIILTAADTDTITWQLEIVANDNHGAPSQKERERVTKAKLSAKSMDEQARLTFVWPRGAKRSDDIHERWTITVPSQLAARVDMEIGKLSIEGLAGGIEADLGIGELRITVPGGDVYAEMGIGDVQITSSTTDLGEVDLDADIGEVRFEGHADAPASDYAFPIGQELHFDAGGEDDVQVNANIGQIVVEITAVK